MPIRDQSIYSANGNDLELTLPIRIINKETNQSIRTFGVVDTGATECAIPKGIALELGHKFRKGSKKIVTTGNGTVIAYGHTFTVEILHPETNEIIYRLNDVVLDCLPKLKIVLLGRKGFLSNFKLTLNYPKKIFSLAEKESSD